MPLAAFDFTTIDLNAGWQRPAGYPENIFYKVLSSDFDEKSKRGKRTTLIRWLPGAAVNDVITHDFVEELYVISGSLLWLDGDGKIIGRIGPNSYVRRPAGVPHGPFRADEEFFAIEFSYYDER